MGATNVGSTAAAKILKLDGTSTGNSISGVISNGIAGATMALTKSNTSTWTLTNTETYTGATLVQGGTLVLGSGRQPWRHAHHGQQRSHLAVAPGTGATNTAAGSTLTLSAGSILSMNDGVTSNFNVAGATTMSATDILNFDLGGTTSAVDKLALTGAVTTGGGVISIAGYWLPRP